MVSLVLYVSMESICVYSYWRGLVEVCTKEELNNNSQLIVASCKGSSLKTMNISITPYGFIISRIYVNMYSDISPVDVYS